MIRSLIPVGTLMGMCKFGMESGGQPMQNPLYAGPGYPYAWSLTRYPDSKVQKRGSTIVVTELHQLAAKSP